MSKFRIIPIVLTDGVNTLKGEQFNPWRPVGIIQSALNIYESRDVDEFVLIDVSARSKSTSIDQALIKVACETLSVPLTIGGGLTSVDQIRASLKAGADKVILGTSAFTNPNLVSEASLEFGSQAIICSLDIDSNNQNIVYTQGGQKKLELDAIQAAQNLERLGAGELLIQLVDLEGKLSGINLEIANKIMRNVNIPVSVGGGISNPKDFLQIYKSGFSGAVVGALFQFTENTPNSIRDFLASMGVEVRNKFKS
jgi:cyclase